MPADARTDVPISRATTPLFLRYASAGAIGTVAHYALLICLVHFAGVAAVAASTAGAITGAIVNYVLNHRFTFASLRSHRVAFPRFAIVSALGIGLNAAVLASLLATEHVHYLVAQAAATGAVLLFGFVANRKWTF